MTERIFCVPEEIPALQWAAYELRRLGQTVTNTPDASVTHLLLGVPCTQTESDLIELLAKLPADITILGGKLTVPALSAHKRIDLLQDETYLWKNAAITAQIAVTLGARQMGIIWEDASALILGWGRIGQCLAKYLSALGAKVSVAARKEVHRAQIAALGYMPLNSLDLSDQLEHFRIIYNTVPAPVLSADQLRLCRPDCVKLELASTDGMDAKDVLTARKLPGIYAPETSGKLIAATILRLCSKEDQL